MASSYYFGDALTVLAPAIPRASEAAFATRASNAANDLFWGFADWPETITTLPSFWMQPDEQDHGAPAVIVPTDFRGLRQVYGLEINGDSSRRWPIKVQRDVELTHATELPKRIQYMPATQSFRVWPRVPQSAGSPRYLITGTYKLRPTRVTAGTLHSTLLPWEDDDFHVYVACLKWALYFFSGDQRAGQIVKQGSSQQYTGALAEAIFLLEQLADNEMLEQGEPGLAPEESLGGFIDRAW